MLWFAVLAVGLLHAETAKLAPHLGQPTV